MTRRELNRATLARQLLSHADRSWVIPEGRARDLIGRPVVLVDGVAAGGWRSTGERVEVAAGVAGNDDVAAEAHASPPGCSTADRPSLRSRTEIRPQLRS